MRASRGCRFVKHLYELQLQGHLFVLLLSCCAVRSGLPPPYFCCSVFDCGIIITRHRENNLRSLHAVPVCASRWQTNQELLPPTVSLKTEHTYYTTFLLRRLRKVLTARCIRSTIRSLKLYANKWRILSNQTTQNFLIHTILFITKSL